MIWLEKTFDFGGAWVSDQDRLGKLQLTLAASGDQKYLQLLMVRDEDDQSLVRESDRILIGLPETALCSVFPTFQALKRPLPKVASLQYGDQSEFEKFFAFPFQES